jgi:hypothetical protein
MHLPDMDDDCRWLAAKYVAECERVAPRPEKCRYPRPYVVAVIARAHARLALEDAAGKPSWKYRRIDPSCLLCRLPETSLQAQAVIDYIDSQCWSAWADDDARQAAHAADDKVMMESMSLDYLRHRMSERGRPMNFSKAARLIRIADMTAGSRIKDRSARLMAKLHRDFPSLFLDARKAKPHLIADMAQAA